MGANTCLLNTVTIKLMLIQLQSKTIILRPSLFFLCFASTAFPDIGPVGQIEKKNLKTKITRSLGIGGPGTPG